MPPGETAVAYVGDGGEAGAPLTVERSTIIGVVHTRIMRLASNSIFLAAASEDVLALSPVRAERLQEGCVRFCFAPPGSRLPRRYRCLPTDGGVGIRPVFTSLRYGRPGYCQLSRRCPVEIREGADDGAEMGAFHNLFQPQREANLRLRFQEYLRFGLEAGIFFET